MTTQSETGGPAFTIVFEKEDYIHDGMTLRDYFAAKELTAGLCGVSCLHDKLEAKRIATHCYLMADAMLEARK